MKFETSDEVAVRSSAEIDSVPGDPLFSGTLHTDHTVSDLVLINDPVPGDTGAADVASADAGSTDLPPGAQSIGGPDAGVQDGYVVITDPVPTDAGAADVVPADAGDAGGGGSTDLPPGAETPLVDPVSTYHVAVDPTSPDPSETTVGDHWAVDPVITDPIETTVVDHWVVDPIIVSDNPDGQSTDGQVPDNWAYTDYFPIYDKEPVTDGATDGTDGLPPLVYTMADTPVLYAASDSPGRGSHDPLPFERTTTVSHAHDATPNSAHDIDPDITAIHYAAADTSHDGLGLL
jgi:hypothetical protein